MTPTNTPNAKTLIKEVQALVNKLKVGGVVKEDGNMGTITLTALKRVLQVAVKDSQAAQALTQMTIQKAAAVQPAKPVAPAPTPASPPAPPYVRPMRSGAIFEKIVKHYEGCSKKIYRIDGKLHGGYGHQLYDDEGWKEGDTIPEATINMWFAEDRLKAEMRLNKLLTGRVNQAQYDVLCSIVWNGGNHDDPENRKDAPIFWHSPKGVLMEAVNDERWAAAGEIILALGKKPTSSGKIYQGIENRRKTEEEAWRGAPFKLR